jgi:vacuolar-type H+-ATPase subunit E/Vma4
MAKVIGSFDDLRESVIDETRQKKRAYQGEAGRSIKEIKQSAENQADEVKERILEEAKKKAEEIRVACMEKANKKAVKKKLLAREDLLDEVWRKTETQLRNLVDNQEAYLDALDDLANLAVEVLGSGKIELALDPEGHKILTDDNLKKWSQKASQAYDTEIIFSKVSEPIDSWGGLIANKVDSKKRLDARFSVRLRIAREELREDIFKILMGENGQ